jgi:hypothetical protein
LRNIQLEAGNARKQVFYIFFSFLYRQFGAPNSITFLLKGDKSFATTFIRRGKRDKKKTWVVIAQHHQALQLAH